MLRAEALWKYNPIANTLGDTTAGNIPFSIQDVIGLSKFAATDNCIVVSLKAFILIDGATAVSMKGIIYDETYTKVAETAEIAPSAGAATWIEAFFIIPVLLDKGREYWFGFWATGTSGTIQGYQEAGNAGQFASQAITYSSTETPDPLIPDSTTDFKMSIYANLSKYADLTNNSENINFISSSSDVFYIGFSRRFVGLVTDLSTSGVYSNVTYEYLSTATTWKKLQLIDNYTFSESKYQRWNLPPDWARIDFTSAFPESVDPPDAVGRYWIRIRASAVTTTAVLSLIRIIPFAQYTTPAKVSEFLGIKKPLDLTTKPSENTVEDMIRRAEDRIDYRTKKSWRFNAVAEDVDPKYIDYSRSGMFLRYRNFYRIYSIQIWNGSQWTLLTEGRSNDYQVDYNLGFIYLTRSYILPAVFGVAGRYTQYNVAEYKNAIRVDYAYGRDPETDREFYNVEDLATKMVAVDLLRHQDYTIYTVSGADSVPLSEKIRNLEEQIEMHIDELTGVTLV